MRGKTTNSRTTDQDQRVRLRHCLLLTACFMLTFSNCNETFQPLQENEEFHFNISGFLDAAADTQWIRVGTVRQTIDEPPDPTGIQVTLKHIQTGQTVVMNDSVFTSRNVLNYWTTMDIEQEQTYRITAERADGETSQAIVMTPSELPSISITVQGNHFFGTTPGANIRIDEAVDRIADLQSVWYVILNPGMESKRRIYKFSLRNTLRQSDIFGDSFAFANWEEEQEQIEQSIGGAEMAVAARQFFVATGGPEWDGTLSSINDIEFFLNETVSNVENGLGYVVGVNSGWFRQTPCLAPDRSRDVPCTPDDGPFWHHE